MKKAVWGKLQSAPFQVIFTEVQRPMHDWEVAMVRIDPNIENTEDTALSVLQKTIGERLIKKYWIELN